MTTRDGVELRWLMTLYHDDGVQTVLLEIRSDVLLAEGLEDGQYYTLQPESVFASLLNCLNATNEVEKEEEREAMQSS